MNKGISEKLFSVIEEIPVLPKNVQGYGYKYCNLDTIFSVIKPIMAKHGLCFIQKVTVQEGVTGVETVIFDKEGNSESSFTPLPDTTVKGANNAQNMGASITYVKRYAITSFLDICADEDTDGVVVPRESINKESFIIDSSKTPAENLKAVLNKFGAKLERQKGMINDALAGSENEVAQMLDRTLTYLRNLGLIN